VRWITFVFESSMKTCVSSDTGKWRQTIPMNRLQMHENEKVNISPVLIPTIRLTRFDVCERAESIRIPIGRSRARSDRDSWTACMRTLLNNCSSVGKFSASTLGTHFGIH
jgi:hypothetical protein